MPLRLDENDADSKLNPGQSDYDQKFNDIARHENNSEFDSMVNDPANGLADVEKAAAKGGIDQSQELSDQEDGNTGFSSSFTGKNNRQAKGGKWSWKKQGPIGGLIALVFGGAVGFGGLFGGPSLLLVNVSEVLQSKFNTAITSLDNRSTKIMAAKIKGTVSGVCSSRVSIACKYKSLSADEMAGMEKNGITFKNGDTPISSDDIAKGKFRPTKMVFKGEDITPENFASKFASDTEFRTAMQKGLKFNARYATVGGKIWNKIKTVLKTNKSDPFADEKSNATDEDRLKTVQSETTNGEDIKVNETVTASDIADNDPRCGGPCTEQQKASLAQQDNASSSAKASKLVNDSKNPTNAVDAIESANAVTAEAKTAKAVATELVGRAANALKVTGYVDDACSVYNTIKGIGYAAKMIRYAQLARYAILFLKTADMIKAGTAKPGDVSYLATTLTTPLVQKDSNGNTTSSGAATDTLAYRNAAFGDTGTLDTFASNYLVAAGLTGALIKTSSIVNGMIPGGGKATCPILRNPIVGGVSLVIGIVAFILPGSDIAMTAKDAAQVALAVALSAAEIVLPSMLQNIVAGKLIDSNTIGAASGDALVSGAGSLFSTDAQYAGNAPLTPTQAVAYEQAQNQTLAQYAAQDRLAYSPLDPTNNNTFAGTILTQLTRYSGQLSSFGSVVNSIGSLITQSFGIVFKPFAYAADPTSQYTTCQDEDYQTLGIATDLFCNPVRGIPPDFLNSAPDPDVLFDQMVSSGQVNSDGTPLAGHDYAKFVDQCINRDQGVAPLGDNVNGIGDGSNCIIKDQNTANYYVYWNDYNALDQMENGMVQQDTASTTSSSSSSTPVNTSQLYQSSVNTPCAAGTTDAGVAQGYYNGQEIDIRLCSIPGTVDSGDSGQPIHVNSVMSANFLALTQAMGQALGSPVKAASSFRTMDGQQAAYNTYGSSRAAKPGYSNHQMGLAVDFQLATGNNGATKPAGTDRVYDWLVANAATYNIAKLSTEAWHWQAAGAN